MTTEMSNPELAAKLEAEYRPFELLHWCGSVGAEKPTKGNKYRQGTSLGKSLVQK